MSQEETIEEQIERENEEHDRRIAHLRQSIKCPNQLSRSESSLERSKRRTDRELRKAASTEVRKKRKATEPAQRENFIASKHSMTTQDKKKVSKTSENLQETIIPKELPGMFANTCAQDMKKGVETTGMLFGKTNSENKCTVTHCVLPEQTNTSTSSFITSTQETRKYIEEERNIDNEDLEFIGLIHTHPQSPSFLSSLDMHYLSKCEEDMQKENMISLVLGKNKHKQNTCPAFILTELGQEVIKNCKDRDEHHLHKPNKEIELYTSSKCTKYEGELDIKIRDLR